MKYILAIDQGTTSSRALIFNKFGKLEFKSQMEIECLFPKEGWVEQNALDVWVSVINVINDALAKMNITVDDIYAIGITNQRETTVIWDKKLGCQFIMLSFGNHVNPQVFVKNGNHIKNLFIKKQD